MSGNLARRVGVAAIGIPAALGVVYLGGWILAALIALLGTVGALEIYRMALRTGTRALSWIGGVGAALMPLAAFAAHPQGLGLSSRILLVAGAAWLIAVMAFGARLRTPGDKPLAAISVTVFGALYAGGLPSFLLLLRHGAPFPSALAATGVVFLPIVLTWICDSLAMAGGSTIGGRKLAPVLSPNKTWAGAIWGSVSALAVAPVYGALVLGPAGVTIPLWQLAVFGLVISVIGQAGDVTESLFKREAGVKDSGTFFPGHGGVLDRLDSLYWVIPTAVLLLTAYGTL